MFEIFSPFNDASANSVLFALGVLASGCGLLLGGWSMKLACRFCGGQEIGILRGVVASVACTLVGLSVTWGISGLASQPSTGTGSLYGLLAAVATLALVLVQNPLRAFFTYIVYGVVGSAAALAAAAAVATLVYVFASDDRIEQLAKHYASHSQMAPAALTAPLERWIGPGQASSATGPAAGVTPPSRKKPAAGVKSNPFVQ